MPSTTIANFDAGQIPDVSDETSFHANATYVIEHLAAEIIPGINTNLDWMNAALVGAETIVDAVAALQGLVGGTTAFAKTLIDDVDAAAARSTLGAQAHSANLTASLAALTFPTADGTSGQALVTDGAGNLNWAAGASVAEISVSDFTNVSEVVFTGLETSPFANFAFILDGVQMTSDPASLRCQLIPSGSSTPDSGASDYRYTSTGAHDGGTAFSFDNAGAAQIQLTSSVGAAAGEDGVAGTVELYAPARVERTKLFVRASYQQNASRFERLTGGGLRNASTAMGGIRFFASTGNLTGRIRLVGMGIK
jgi:hypothetical protein